MIQRLFFSFFLLFSLFCFSLIPYRVGWDLDFSPYAGGEDLLFAHRIIEKIERYFLKKTPIASSLSPQNRFWRFNELYFGWLPLNYLVTVAQHEVFGHGYRIRSLGNQKAEVKGYQFFLPPPFSEGGALTRYDVDPSFTTTEESAVATAGVESTAILALLTKFKWLEGKKIDPRQSALYILCQQDIALYIGSLKIVDEEEEGHDIQMYLRSLNQTYTTASLTKGRLRSLSWINLFDPFTFYAGYSWFRYIVCGKKTHIPQIKIGPFSYLPSFRLGLTPFGPEIFSEHFLLKQASPSYLYFKGGKQGENLYGGLGFYCPLFWQKPPWFLGIRFDAWRQPKLLLTPSPLPYPLKEQRAMRQGTALSLIFGYRPHEKGCIEGEIGGKTEGFLPGFPLIGSGTYRCFFSLLF